MQNFKIIQVLSSLDKKELKRFGEFVDSPYFNKNKNIRKLFEVLEKFHPAFEGRNFTLEKIYAKVFAGDEYDYHKINNVISDLYQLSEEFLAHRKFENREYYIERNIFTELRAKGLYRIYEQKYNSYMKELIERKYKDEDYYYYLYEMNDEYLWYATMKNPNTELNILQTQFDHFFQFAIIRILRLYNLMLHERNQNNFNYRLTMFDEILNYVRNIQTEDNPLLLIFKTILLLLHSKDKKYYDELWRLKERYIDDFRSDDRNLIYIHLYDFAAYMVNFKGDDSYNHDMFKIYKEQIDRHIMVPEGFNHFNFMNVVKIACRINEFDYAENFIKEFRSSIPKEEETNVLEFCYGTIENAMGNLQKALKHFSKTNFQNFLLKVQVKIVLLKIYFKLEMYEQALALIDTFRHYISREENLLTEHREAYSKFLKLMSELIRANEIHDKEERNFRISKIRDEADKIPSNPFRIKVWLQNELNQLVINN